MAAKSPTKSVKPTVAKTQAAQVPTSAELASQVKICHQKIAKAVHGVLAKQGIRGLTMHSIRFNLAANATTDAGCVPPCSANETCRMHCGDDGCYPVCIPND
jgi:hypothetical protein